MKKSAQKSSIQLVWWEVRTHQEGYPWQVHNVYLSRAMAVDEARYLLANHVKIYVVIAECVEIVPTYGKRGEIKSTILAF